MIWRELEKPVAFVLGGGGSLGAMQVGMLEAIAEHAIVPDLVVGTSVGAINGAILAADPQGAAHRLAHSWSRLDASGVFPRSVMGPLRALRERRNHLVSESGLAGILSENLPSGASFEHLAVPLHVVTTDAATGEAMVISSGPLVPALLASAAIPGIFPPVERDGRILFDGGLVANLPIRQAVQRGAKSLVLLDCTFPGHPPIAPGTLAQTMLFAATAMLRQQTADALAAIPSDVTVLYLPGPPPKPVWPLQFRHTLELIEAGYASAHEFLDGTATAKDGADVCIPSVTLPQRTRVQPSWTPLAR
jgi:NTE family protein